MPDNLLAPARRARRNPLKKRDINRVERELKSLVADPQHGQSRDKEFSGFVSRQFERVYGTGLTEPDATGRARPRGADPGRSRGLPSEASARQPGLRPRRRPG